ncbi:hypothetical protein V8C44DRAFT_316727 [Trichoderma aethiopicum]
MIRVSLKLLLLVCLIVSLIRDAWGSTVWGARGEYHRGESGSLAISCSTAVLFLRHELVQAWWRYCTKKRIPVVSCLTE